MRQAGVIALVVSLFASALIAAQKTDPQFFGTVTDADGKPVANATLATNWDFSRGRFSSGGSNQATGADGSFSFPIRANRWPVGVMVMDAERKMGSVAMLDEASCAHHVVIRLRPLVPVHVDITIKELPGVHDNSDIEIFLNDPKDENRQFWLANASVSKESPLRLPAGSYRLLVRTQNIGYFQHRFTVPEGAESVNLGTLVAEASTTGKLFGKVPPPLQIADARGLPKTTTLEDFRGKWVLIDFWAHWCVPCVNSMPKVMQFWDKHQAHRDKFEIIAFHDASVKTLEEMDAKLVKIKADVWNGRDLPFPILLDAPGAPTVKSWGTTAIPNMLLIAPDGKLMRVSNPLAYLEQQLSAKPQ